MGNCLASNSGLETSVSSSARTPSNRVNTSNSRRVHSPSSGSSSSHSFPLPTHVCKNKPLRKEAIRWKSDIPLTEGQLRSKRDEFWDTAPAFEGKQEIWSALKAAAEAVEGNKDYALAQAILDGAAISIPHGSLVEAYDEWGTRYVIPVYCLSLPTNLVDCKSDPSVPHDYDLTGEEEPQPGSEEASSRFKLKIRISLTGKDVKLIVNSDQSILAAKRRLQLQEERVSEPSRQRWYFGGKLLGDKTRVKDIAIPNGYVIQCVISPLEFGIIQS